MRAGSVGDLLDQAWRKQFPDGKPEWADGLHALHVRKWILRRVAVTQGVRLAHLREHDPDCAAPRATTRGMGRIPADELAGTLPDWLANDECWAITERLGRLAGEWAGAARRHFDGLDPRPAVTGQRISEKACAVVARPYAAGPALPDPIYLERERERYQKEEQLRAARVRRLPTEDAFVAARASEYEVLWSARRATVLAEVSPIDLGLGWLEHPPMTSVGDEVGWQAGTDLAVALRYRRYRRLRWSADPDAAGLDDGWHVRNRLLVVTPDELCRDVLDRACSPLGLRQRGHRAALRAFVDGVRTADLVTRHDHRAERRLGARTGADRTLAEWVRSGAEPEDGSPRELPDQPDPAFAEAVRGEAEYWVAYGGRAGEMLDGLARRPPYWPLQVELGTSRKLWSMVHSREVEWEEQLRRAELARLIRQVFGAHLNQQFARPILEPGPQPAVDERPLDPEDDRLTATLVRLAAAGPVRGAELARLMTAGDERWRASYREHVPAEDVFLTPDEFHRWFLCNMAGPAGEDG